MCHRIARKSIVSLLLLSCHSLENQTTLGVGLFVSSLLVAATLSPFPTERLLRRREFQMKGVQFTTTECTVAHVGTVQEIISRSRCHDDRNTHTTTTKNETREGFKSVSSTRGSSRCNCKFLWLEHNARNGTKSIPTLKTPVAIGSRF